MEGGEMELEFKGSQSFVDMKYFAVTDLEIKD